MWVFSRFTIMSLNDFNTSMDVGFLLIGVSIDNDSPLGVRALIRSTMDTIVQTNDLVRFSVTKLLSSQSRPAPFAGPFTEPMNNLDNLDTLLNADNRLHDENDVHDTITLCKKELPQTCHYFSCFHFR
jgi:hypothetical protein